MLPSLLVVNRTELAVGIGASFFARRARPATSPEKIVVDFPPLNLINFKACKLVCFQGMRMSSCREGAR